MKRLLFSLLLLVSFATMAQTPFAISNRENFKTEKEIIAMVNRKLSRKLELRSYESEFVAVNKAETSALEKAAAIKQFNINQMREAEKPDLAEKLSTGVVIKGEVDKLFPTLVGDVVTYRLKLWNRLVKTGEGTQKRKVNFYLPLSLVSKISGSNEDNAGTVNDAVSYFGAPLTFRLSPNLLDISSSESSARFVVGMHHDFRAFGVGDTLTDNVEIGFGYYGAFGFSFFNKGDAWDPQTSAWIEGRWSISALVYVFRSGGKFKEAVFGAYDQKSISGFEFMFRFRTDDEGKKKFNFFIGANTGFTENAPNYKKWDIRFGIGN